MWWLHLPPPADYRKERKDVKVVVTGGSGGIGNLDLPRPRAARI